MKQGYNLETLRWAGQWWTGVEGTLDDVEMLWPLRPRGTPWAERSYNWHPGGKISTESTYQPALAGYIRLAWSLLMTMGPIYCHL